MRRAFYCSVLGLFLLAACSSSDSTTQPPLPTVAQNAPLPTQPPANDAAAQSDGGGQAQTPESSEGALIEAPDGQVLPTTTPDATIPVQLTQLAAAAATATTIVERELDEPLPTIEGQASAATAIFEADLPLPGTLIAPATEDPNAGLLFDSLVFVQVGGPAESVLTVELHRDGTLIRDDVTTTVAPEVVAGIDRTLDDIGFFGLRGTFTSPGGRSDIYRYTLQVVRGGATRSLRAQDGLIPAELRDLFVALSQLGLDAPPRPGGQ